MVFNITIRQYVLVHKISLPGCRVHQYRVLCTDRGLGALVITTSVRLRGTIGRRSAPLIFRTHLSIAE